MMWDGRVQMVFQMIDMIHRDQSKPPALEKTRLRQGRFAVRNNISMRLNQK